MNKIQKDFKLGYDIRLKKIRSSYTREIANHDYSHLTDYIALDVLDSLNLLHYQIRRVNEADIKFINLKRLFTEHDTWNPFYDDYIPEDRRDVPYVIPSLESIDNFLKRYLKIMRSNSKNNASFQKAIEEYAGTIWIKDMITSGIFKPGDMINLVEFNLMDFITDDRLKSLFGITDRKSFRFNDKNSNIHPTRQHKKERYAC